MRFRYSIFVLALLVVSGSSFSEDDRKPGRNLAAQSIENPIEMNDASVKQGRQMFVRLCVTCHGMDGKGETDMHDKLEAPPSDLTNGEWKYGGTDGEVMTLVRDGTNLGMPAFVEKLNEARLWHVVNYLRTIGPEPGIDAPKEEEIPENALGFSMKSASLGQRLYVRSCLQCHGEDGKGDTEMREFLPTHPSDLSNEQWTYGDEDGHIFLIIKNGTEYDMPGFEEELSDERIWHIVNYLRMLGPNPPEE
jgi:mono/diheme cytochrome c family protein